MQGDEWKGHLMSQVAFFVGLIRDGLREVKHVPPELLSRLNIYLERLGPPIPASNETNGDAASTAPTVTPLATSAAASELVRQVALVFGVPEEQLKRDITAIKRFCTEKVRPCSSHQVLHRRQRTGGSSRSQDLHGPCRRWRSLPRSTRRL